MLSPEDTLRLNVLLASKPLAIRIDESRLTVHGLGDAGEAKLQLTPSGGEERYLKAVRELLSAHVLGSPGGYPVYLQRWTRMGQMRDDSLEQLLLLGEPEAVVAAVCAPGLTDELARRAWWAMEDADNARRMLAREAVCNGRMGPVLARYLLEYLPFETEPEVMVETVRLILQPGLLAQASIDDLWRKSQRKHAYLVGFLLAIPNALPLQAEPIHEENITAQVEQLAEQGNPVARCLSTVVSAAGQAFVQTLQTVLKKSPNQEVLMLTLEAARCYFDPLRPGGDPDLDWDGLQADADDWLRQPDTAQARLLAELPQLAERLRAMRLLSGVGYGILRPLLRDSTAIGSLMRRKLQPVLEPLNLELNRLQKTIF